MATMNASSSAAIAGVDMARFWPGTSGGTIVVVVTATATQFRVTVDVSGGSTYATITAADFFVI